jgi:hypothetical protein
MAVQVRACAASKPGSVGAHSRLVILVCCFRKRVVVKLTLILSFFYGEQVTAANGRDCECQAGVTVDTGAACVPAPRAAVVVAPPPAATNAASGVLARQPVVAVAVAAAAAGATAAHFDFSALGTAVDAIARVTVVAVALPGGAGPGNGGGGGGGGGNDTTGNSSNIISSTISSSISSSSLSIVGDSADLATVFGNEAGFDGRTAAFRELALTAPRGSNVTLEFSVLLRPPTLDLAVVPAQWTIAIGTCEDVFGRGSQLRAGTLAECECAPGFRETQTDGGDGTRCEPCPTGSFSATPGARSCTCSAGFTRPAQAGATDPCVPCAPGSFKNTTGPGACLCASNFYNIPPSDQCLPCPVGSYKPDPGPGRCDICAPGYELASGSDSAACVACPVGSASPGGFGARCECITGYILTANGDCARCSDNSIIVNTTTAAAAASGPTVGSASAADTVLEDIGTSEAVWQHPGVDRLEATASVRSRRATTGQQLSTTLQQQQQQQQQSGAVRQLPGRRQQLRQLPVAECVCDARFHGDGLTCTPCPPGAHKPRPGRGDCSCLPGHFRQPDADASAACEPCAAGSYASESGSVACTSCPLGSTTVGPGAAGFDECRCKPGYFQPALLPSQQSRAASRAAGGISASAEHCQLCPAHADCQGGTEPPRAVAGYWASPDNALAMYPCDDQTGACTGDGQCAPAHTGLLCQECAPGHGRLGFSCPKCNPVLDWLNLIFVFIAVLLVLVYLVTSARRAPQLHSAMLRPLLDHVQVTFFIGAFGYGYPRFVSRAVFQSAAVATCGTRFIPGECTLSLTPPGTIRLLAGTGLTLAVALSAAGTLRYFGPARFTALFSQLSSIFLSISLFFHPILTLESLEAFSCININGKRVLKIDVTTDCDSSSFRQVRALAAANLALFSTGTAIWLALFLLTIARGAKKRGGAADGGGGGSGGSSSGGSPAVARADSVAPVGPDGAASADGANANGTNANGSTSANADTNANGSTSANADTNANGSASANADTNANGTDPNANGTGANAHGAAELFAFLVFPVRDGALFWPLVPFARKLLLMALAVAARAMPEVAAAAAAIVLAASAGLVVFCRPYRRAWERPHGSLGLYDRIHDGLLRIGGIPTIELLALGAALTTLLLGPPVSALQGDDAAADGASGGLRSFLVRACCAKGTCPAQDLYHA